VSSHKHPAWRGDQGRHWWPEDMHLRAFLLGHAIDLAIRSRGKTTLKDRTVAWGFNGKDRASWS
jgi:hypothetical protein